jgi:shikimate dehydrogenase
LTRRIGLIGYPVRHSISPIFQQAALDALGIDARYEAWETPPTLLQERFTTLHAADILGANVTVPHKEAALAYVDRIDPLARRAGAINTIYRAGNVLAATNTDIAGFRRALREAGGFAAAGARALVLGAGGAARAVVLALEMEGAASIAVANRTEERARRLVADLRSDAGPDLFPLPWEEAVSREMLAGIDLLVHCTTLGLAGSPQAGASPVAAAALHAGLFVADVVANPRETPLLRAARAAGARTLDGLPMLVYQGAEAFALWTGQPAPVAVMLAAAEAAMERHAG